MNRPSAACSAGRARDRGPWPLPDHLGRVEVEVAPPLDLAALARRDHDQRARGDAIELHRVDPMKYPLEAVRAAERSERLMPWNFTAHAGDGSAVNTPRASLQ
jgi:hypothetical protein